MLTTSTRICVRSTYQKPIKARFNKTEIYLEIMNLNKHEII